MKRFTIALAAVFVLAFSTSMAQAQCHSGGYVGGGYGYGGYACHQNQYLNQYIHTGYHCYPRTYNSWSRYCYFSQHRCYGYYCPQRRCWYYWYAPFNRYMPVQYIDTYRPTANINVNNNTNINTNVNTNVNGTPALPAGAVAVPPSSGPVPVPVK